MFIQLMKYFLNDKNILFYSNVHIFLRHMPKHSIWFPGVKIKYIDY